MFRKKIFIPCSIFVAVALSAVSCGGGSGSGMKSIDPNSELSIEAQIGPITELEFGDFDEALAAKGEAAFKLRCTACHQLETKVIGPPLGTILESRSPVYVMNMIMNPTGMLAQHPVAKEQLAQYAVPMADLGVSEEDARAILEYLRKDFSLGQE